MTNGGTTGTMELMGRGGESDKELEDRPVSLEELKSDCSTDDDPEDHDDPHTPRIHVVAGEPSSIPVDGVRDRFATHRLV